MIRPRLKDVCSAVEAFFIAAPYGSYCFLTLTESGGFDLLRYYTEGAVEIINGSNLRKSVRKALDAAENMLHDRRRETNARKTIEQEE